MQLSRYLVLPFVLQYKVVLAFESVDEILKSDHPTEIFGEQYFPVVLFVQCCTRQL